MEHLLTTNQALFLIAVALIMLYLIVTTKSTNSVAQIESDIEVLEMPEGN